MTLSTLFRRSHKPAQRPSRAARPIDVAAAWATRPHDTDDADDGTTGAPNWLDSSLDLRRGLEVCELAHWPADWPGALPPHAPRHAGPSAATAVGA